MSAVIYRLDFDCRDGRVYSYWGSSVKWKQRIHAHRSALRKGKHGNQRMQRTFDKYGDFRESVVMLSDRESLAENERCMIVRHYRREYCLNLTMETVSAFRDPGVVRKRVENPEWQKNVRAGAQKRMADPEWQKNVRAGAQKRMADPEWQKNVRAANQKRFGRKLELTIPGKGSKSFPSVGAAATEIGVHQKTLGDWLRGQSPWPGQGRNRTQEKFAHLVGLTGRYL